MLTTSYLQHHQLRITTDTDWFVKNKAYYSDNGATLIAVNENTLDVVDNKNYKLFNIGTSFTSSLNDPSAPLIHVLEIQWLEQKPKSFGQEDLPGRNSEPIQIELNEDWYSTISIPAKITSKPEVIEDEDGDLLITYQIEYINEQF